jgi:scyllo-inositol 2-dehydrogenase (NADP+)
MRLGWVVELGDPALAAAVAWLRGTLAAAGATDVTSVTGATGASAVAAAGGRPDATLVWADRPLPPDAVPALLATGAPVALCGPTLERADPSGALARAAGLRPGGATPVHDVRVRAGPDGGALERGLPGHSHRPGTHLGAHAHLTDRVLARAAVSPGVHELLTAHVGLAAHPVATWCPGSGVLAWTPGTRPAAVTAPDAVRLLLLALLHAAGRPPAADVRVGLLGYGAIGHEHSRAVRGTPGLALAAVADAHAERRTAAVAAAPGVAAHETAEELLAGDADLVVVSTPPSTHARWALAAIEAGKHVVVEKPFALRTADVDAVLAAAGAAGRLAAVYQNRRFDPDHLALRRLVRDGALGDVFHVEAFVGGHGHPCNLWHSDAGVSGGAVYDWGAHVLDQVLDLLPGPVAHVTATEQKRRWHDVTNADHARVTIAFDGGAEATFVYSDLAAALKPRWYVLGTDAAVVGSWRTERVVGRDDVGLLVEDVLAPADAPPRLDLHAPDGSVTRVATPAGPPYPFHAELADHVQLGLPMSVTGGQSRRVVAVLEAAVASAAAGGRPVVPA